MKDDNSIIEGKAYNRIVDGHSLGNNRLFLQPVISLCGHRLKYEAIHKRIKNLDVILIDWYTPGVSVPI